ncbi:MAG: hypothetical protein R3D44_17690 [Hyphomicrobiaceae bacterium]
MARRLRGVLDALRSGARGRQRTAVSALAEGSDRLFAMAALDLGYRLEVLLPCQSADYETTFGDPSTTEAYRALLARADSVRELPGALTDSKAAYEAVGHATVSATNVLIAVWDGRPAAGRGGTPEIIAHALALGRPVIWIDAARSRLPGLIAAPTASGSREISLDRLASRARPLTRRRLAQIGARLTGAMDFAERHERTKP